MVVLWRRYGSLRAVPSVDHDGLAGHAAGLVGREEDGVIGNLLRSEQAPLRNKRVDHCLQHAFNRHITCPCQICQLVANQRRIDVSWGTGR